MSTRLSAPRTRGLPEALLRLAMIAAPLAAAPSASAKHSLHSNRPYLAAVGAPQLRFQEPPAPPDMSIRPPSTEQERNEADAQFYEMLAANAAAAKSTPPLPMDTAAPDAGTTAPDAPETSDDSPERTPTRILPDDTRRRGPRPEDVIPYFQFPGTNPNNDNVNVILPLVPTPADAPRLPPSSATYRQQ